MIAKHKYNGSVFHRVEALLFAPSDVRTCFGKELSEELRLCKSEVGGSATIHAIFLLPFRFCFGSGFSLWWVTPTTQVPFSRCALQEVLHFTASSA